MSNWIVRCANPRCRHICDDSNWVSKPKANPSEVERKLRVSVSHCPKCDCTSYYKANAKEIARFTK